MNALTAIIDARRQGRLNWWAAVAGILEAVGADELYAEQVSMEVAYNDRPPKPEDCKDTPGDSARQMDVDLIRSMGLYQTGKQRRAVWKDVDAVENAALTEAVLAARAEGLPLTDPVQYGGPSAFTEAARVLGIAPATAKRRFYEIHKIKERSNGNAT